MEGAVGLAPEVTLLGIDTELPDALVGDDEAALDCCDEKGRLMLTGGSIPLLLLLEEAELGGAD